MQKWINLTRLSHDLLVRPIAGHHLALPSGHTPGRDSKAGLKEMEYNMAEKNWEKKQPAKNFEKGDFWIFFFLCTVLQYIQHCFIRFPWVGECWDRTQDCCDFGTDSQTVYTKEARSHPQLGYISFTLDYISSTFGQISSILGYIFSYQLLLFCGGIRIKSPNL